LWFILWGRTMKFSIGQQIICVRFGLFYNGIFDIILISGRVISYDADCICYKTDKGKIEFSKPKYAAATAREAFEIIKDRDIGIDAFHYYISASTRKPGGRAWTRRLESICIRSTTTFDDLEHNPYWPNLLEVLGVQHE